MKYVLIVLMSTPVPVDTHNTWTHTERLIDAQGQQRFLGIKQWCCRRKIVFHRQRFICLCFIQFTVT